MKYTKLQAGARFRIEEDEVINVRGFRGADKHGKDCSLVNNVVTAHKGFLTDFASGPTIDSPETRQAAVAHDVLYLFVRSDPRSFWWRAAFRWYADRALRQLLKRNYKRMLKRRSKPWKDAEGFTHLAYSWQYRRLLGTVAFFRRWVWWAGVLMFGLHAAYGAQPHEELIEIESAP